ncbi:MAG: hypothetical protein HY720_12000 [Planctomycetes bacterium]|nr:hypothetical protein [Planctomycetota bacterium]
MLRSAILALALLVAGCSKEAPAPPGKPISEPSTPNLLVNGDLEVDGLVGWEYRPNRHDDVVAWSDAVAEAAAFRTGTLSAKLGPIDSKGGESSQCLVQTVDVTTSRIWIDGWVRFEGKKRAGDGRVRAGIQVQYHIGQDEVLGNLLGVIGPPGGEFPPDTGMLALTLAKEEKSSWCQLPYHTTEELAVKGLTLSKAPTQVTLLLWLQVEGAAEGKAWFDDLVVKEMK